MRSQAIYMNGIFQVVLDDIVKVQTEYPHQVLFLQPYSSDAIAYLRDDPPTPSDPVKLYASVTDDLQHVRYTADVIAWRDKTLIPHDSDQHRNIEEIIAKYQPTEEGLYHVPEGGISRNLLYVMRMRRLAEPFSVDNLFLIDGNRPVSLNKTQPGGWMNVHPLPKNTSLI